MYILPLRIVIHCYCVQLGRSRVTASSVLAMSPRPCTRHPPSAFLPLTIPNMSERYDRSSRGDGRDRYESDMRRNGDEGQHPSSSSARGGSRGYDDGDRRGRGGYGGSSRGGGDRRGYERDSRRRSRSRSPPRRGPPGRGDYREDRDRDRRPPGAEGEHWSAQLREVRAEDNCSDI